MEGFSAWPLVIGWIGSLIVLGGIILLISKFAIDKADAKDIPAVLTALGTMLNTLTTWMPRLMARAGDVCPKGIEGCVDPSTQRLGDPCHQEAGAATGRTGGTTPGVAGPSPAVEPSSEEAA